MQLQYQMILRHSMQPVTQQGLDREMKSLQRQLRSLLQPTVYYIAEVHRYLLTLIRKHIILIQKILNARLQTKQSNHPGTSGRTAMRYGCDT